jgi:hypothetical protein
MGELVPAPVVVKAAILGFATGDHVLEVIEYPSAPGARQASGRVTDTGITHVGLVCDDVDAERTRLAAAGAELLTRAVADVAGLRTAWIRDPFGVVFILLEKRHDDRPYWHQHAAIS